MHRDRIPALMTKRFEVEILSSKFKKLVISLLISIGVGFLSGYLTKGSMKIFESLTKPYLSPPGILFPIVWSVLFTLMGVSAYLIWTSVAPKSQKKQALTVFGVQLAVNFFWSIIFFNLGAYLFAFIWLLLLWVLIIAMIYLFGKISRTAARLQIPYLLWVSFAGYLNLSIYLLNK